LPLRPPTMIRMPNQGDINKSGDHIYHGTGAAYHSRTKINEATGERRFCFEDEAQAAG
jgi:hypothetical protein